MRDLISLVIEQMQRAQAGQPILLPPHPLWAALYQESFTQRNLQGEVQFRSPDTESPIVVLVSAGLDSTVAYHRAVRTGRPVQAIFCRLKNGYEQRERQALEILGIPYQEYGVDVVHHAEQFGYVIPGRNLLFCLIGADALPMGGEVWLSAVSGEIKAWGGDKSERFVGLLNHVLGMRPYPVRVECPTAHETKADLVRWWLDSDLPLAQLHATYSCHRGGEKHCGECQACFRRWVAFACNGLEAEWETDPHASLADSAVQRRLAEARAIKKRGYALATESVSVRDAEQILKVVPS